MDFKVIDKNNQEWPNLIGVFSREFPIAIIHAKALQREQWVSYYGDSYYIVPSKGGIRWNRLKK